MQDLQAQTVERPLAPQEPIETHQIQGIVYIPIEWIREFIPGLARKGKKHEEQVPYDWDA